VIVRFVDIDAIVDHHSLNFHFIIKIIFLLTFLVIEKDNFCFYYSWLFPLQISTNQLYKSKLFLLERIRPSTFCYSYHSIISKL